jgi:hypothetical protein
MWTSLLIAKRRLAAWLGRGTEGQWLLIVCAPTKDCLSVGTQVQPVDRMRIY